jgi:hypothetical protein
VTLLLLLLLLLRLLLLLPLHRCLLILWVFGLACVCLAWRR